MDSHGAIYCDRPRFTLFEVLGWGKTLTFMKYGPTWEKHRKLLQTSFSKTKIRKWRDLQVREARRMVQSMIERPEDWEVSLKR